MTGELTSDKGFSDVSFLLFVPDPEIHYITHTFTRNKDPYFRRVWSMFSRDTMSA